jgi:hypothetical protein
VIQERRQAVQGREIAAADREDAGDRPAGNTARLAAAQFGSSAGEVVRNDY